jgi:predicted aldo/keto reductase-like oxidoreductase
MVLSAKAQPRLGEARVDMGLSISTRDQMWQCIENGLRRVGVEYFDFYQLWDMSADDHFAAGCEGKDSPLQAMREAREQGLVRHLGFTCHGSAEQAIRWLGDVPDFRICTVYYNFNDRATEEVVAYAREHGVGIVIMGPLRGGILVGESDVFGRALPELAGAPVQEVALRFLLGTPGVTTIISGMKELAELEQNARVADMAEPMTTDQRARFVAAFEEFTHGEGLCTNCRYCAGACPESLPVASHMSTYQLYEIFGMTNMATQIAAMTGSTDPGLCTGCGKCVEACPQSLPVPARMERLKEIAASLERE